MKRILFLSLVVLLAASCTQSFERSLVEEVTKDIKSSIDNPESLQVSTVGYAFLSKEELDVAYIHFGSYQIAPISEECIAAVLYSANGIEPDLKFYSCSKHALGSKAKVRELSEFEEYKIEALTESKNVKELK